MPTEVRDAVSDPELVHAVRHLYLHPDVTDIFDVHSFEPDLAGIEAFLCGEHEFGARPRPCRDRSGVPRTIPGTRKLSSRRLPGLPTCPACDGNRLQPPGFRRQAASGVSSGGLL